MTKIDFSSQAFMKYPTDYLGTIAKRLRNDILFFPPKKTIFRVSYRQTYYELEIEANIKKSNFQYKHTLAQYFKYRR
jgi:hypothetical protein